MNEHDDNRDTAISDYLFGEADAAQLAEFEQRMAHDAELRREVEELRMLMADLEDVPGDAWQTVGTGAVEAPPLRLSDSIAAAGGSPDVSREAATAAPDQDRGLGLDRGLSRDLGRDRNRDPDRESRRRRSSGGPFARFFGGSMALRPAVGFAALALVFVGGLGVGVLATGDGGGGGGGGGDSGPIAATQQATLTPVGDLDPQAEGVADFDRDGEKIRLRFSGLAPSTDNDFYEAWMMDPKKGLISIGTFRVGDDGTGQFDLPAPVPGEEYPVIDISIEPLDGKPAHSQKSVLRGTLQ